MKAVDPLVVELAMTKALSSGLTHEDCAKLGSAEAIEVSRRLIEESKRLRAERP
ncbi:MAG TPA: hypothetical protein VLN57_20855 [Xanthobacteraceae bacterium]|nr:hypothetical protein [Xanthobacteraceae bacterium]